MSIRPNPAFQVSRARISRTLVVLESSPGIPTGGGSNGAPQPGVDDILTFDSAIIWSVTAQSFIFTPNKAGFTQRKDILTEKIAQIRFKLRMAFGTGSDAGKIAEVNGVKGLDAALQACAMVSAIGSGIITYMPATMNQLKSCTVWAEHHGQLHKVSACTGNVVMSGNPRTGLEADFTMVGQYSDPEAVGSQLDGYSGGAQTAEPMLNIGMTIDNGTGLYNPVVQSFQFDRGVTTENIENMNEESGLQMTMVGDAQPKMQVVIKQDNNPSAEITYSQFFKDMFAHTTHDVQFTLQNPASGVTGNKIKFEAPEAQLVPGTQVQVNGLHREVALAYKVQSATDEGEFLFSIT